MWETIVFGLLTFFAGAVFVLLLRVIVYSESRKAADDVLEERGVGKRVSK